MLTSQLAFPCLWLPVSFASFSPQEVSGKKLVDFVAQLDGNEEVKALGDEVKVFAARFPMPGFNVNEMRYNTI